VPSSGGVKCQGLRASICPPFRHMDASLPIRVKWPKLTRMWGFQENSRVFRKEISGYIHTESAELVIRHAQVVNGTLWGHHGKKPPPSQFAEGRSIIQSFQLLKQICHRGVGHRFSMQLPLAPKNPRFLQEILSILFQ